MASYSAKKKVFVEGYEFYVDSVDMTNSYHGYGLAGPLKMEVRLFTNASGFSKADWGELMDKLASGKVYVVVNE